MFVSKRKFVLAFLAAAFFLPALFVQTAAAQNYYFQTYLKFDLSNADAPPRISATPDIEFPEAARKNGVEGTVKASLTLAEDGTAKDIKILEGLPIGTSEAIAKGLEQLRFQPATARGKPVAVKLFFDYAIRATYDEFDKNVSKPKITDKPEAVYPESQRAEGRKGKVSVVVAFFADGTTKIIQASSTMPKEFDRAAKDAAAKIKFEPAVHKKSKKPVSQVMTVEYEFKP